MKKKILECSSKGDKRYSAFYARVKIFGKTDSIENHYQLAKRFNDYAPETFRDAKGKIPTHFHLNGVDCNVKYLSSFYKMLWVMYLDKSPTLVQYASRFDDYNDIFKGKSINCQADVIRQYIKEGRQSIIEECKEFIKLLRENK